MRRLALLFALASASLSAQTTQQVETPLDVSSLGWSIGPFAALGAVDLVGNNLTVHFSPSLGAVFLESGFFSTNAIPQFTTGLAFDFFAPEDFTTHFAFRVYNSSIERDGEVQFYSPDPALFTIFLSGFGGGRGVFDFESFVTTSSPVLPLVGANQNPYSDYRFWAIDIVAGSSSTETAEATGDIRFSNIRWISEEPVTATPEPAELLLTATGLVAIGAWSRRKTWKLRPAR